MNRDELGRLFANSVTAVDGGPPITGEDWGADAESRENLCRAAEWFVAHLPAKTRTFYARVSLMGHRSIGLCRVTEAPLAGVTMLRCEKDGGVEWVNPTAVYSVTEVPDAVAEAEIASALRHAESVRVETERRAAQLRSEREAATVDVVVDRESKMIGAIASLTGLLRVNDAALQAALRANGLDGLSLSPLDDDAHASTGFSFYTTTVDSDAKRLVDAMRDLGFSLINVRPAVDCNELVESIPF